MDKLKQVGWVKIDTSEIKIKEDVLSNGFVDKVSEWVRQTENKEVDFILALLNRHGIPINKQNFMDYVNLIVIQEYPTYDYDVTKKVISFCGKTICGYTITTTTTLDDDGNCNIETTLEETKDILFVSRP